MLSNATHDVMNDEYDVNKNLRYRLLLCCKLWRLGRKRLNVEALQISCIFCKKMRFAICKRRAVDDGETRLLHVCGGATALVAMYA